MAEAKDRVRQQRRLRLLAGWHEVRIWVPSLEDAREIQALASRRRKEASSGLPTTGEAMNATNLETVLMAIEAQGSPDFTSPSGPVLTALSEIAAAGDIADVARGFQLFAYAKPANASFVVGHIPAKILNQYFFRRRGLSPSSFFAWEAEHPDWPDRLRDALRDPSAFEVLVLEMAAQIAAS